MNGDGFSLGELIALKIVEGFFPALIGAFALIWFREQVASWLGNNKRKRARVVVESSAGMIFLFTIVLVMGHYLDYLVAELRGVDRSRYGFPTAADIGWRTPENDLERGAALSAVGFSKAFSVRGTSSMSVQVSLDGTVAGRRAGMHQGEVLVDPPHIRPRGYPRDEVMTSLNLAGKTLRASVYVPPKLVGKDQSRPSYLQLFLETCDDQPRRLDLKVENLTSFGRYDLVTDRLNNDKSNICRIGIKMTMPARSNRSRAYPSRVRAFRASGFKTATSDGCVEPVFSRWTIARWIGAMLRTT